MSKYFKIFILFLIFTSTIYLSFVSGFVEFLQNFKNFTLSYIPSELIFIFGLMWFWLIFTLYKNFSD